MEKMSSGACTIKIPNFEGPFDLLFHLIEKNQFNIYDIPISIITDQYMDYLFAMHELNLEITSEFLVMASTLLHIKSKMLLPSAREKREEEPDPREELILKIVEYKKYKEFSFVLKEREKEWEKVFYKLPEIFKNSADDEILSLSPDLLKNVYTQLLIRNDNKKNKNVTEISRLIQHERVSLKSKMREILKILLNKPFFKFWDLFSSRRKLKTEIIMSFLAILELTKLGKAYIVQDKPFADINVYKNTAEIKKTEGGRAATDKWMNIHGIANM